MEQVIREQLEQYFGGQEIGGVRRLAQGWETDVYGFTQAGRALVLRIYNGQNVEARPAVEAQAMTKLGAAGFPVPGLIGYETGRERFGGPFVIMEQLPGQMMWKQFPGAYMGEQMLPLFVGLQVRLHQIEIGHFDGVNTFEVDFVRYMLGLAGVAGAFEPVLERLARWERGVGRERRSLIHGDLHSENIRLDERGRLGVIDWSVATLDDPRMDLAQTYVLEATQGRFQAGERIRMKYEGLSGAPLKDFEFFTTLALCRRMGSVVVSLVGGAHLLGMRPGLEVQLRKDLAGIHRGVDLLSEWSGMPLPEVHRLIDGI